MREAVTLTFSRQRVDKRGSKSFLRTGCTWSFAAFGAIFGPHYEPAEYVGFMLSCDRRREWRPKRSWAVVFFPFLGSWLSGPAARASIQSGAGNTCQHRMMGGKGSKPAAWPPAGVNGKYATFAAGCFWSVELVSSTPLIPSAPSALPLRICINRRLGVLCVSGDVHPPFTV